MEIGCGFDGGGSINCSQILRLLNLLLFFLLSHILVSEKLAIQIGALTRWFGALLICDCICLLNIWRVLVLCRHVFSLHLLQNYLILKVLIITIRRLNSGSLLFCLLMDGQLFLLIFLLQLFILKGLTLIDLLLFLILLLIRCRLGVADHESFVA